MCVTTRVFSYGPSNDYLSLRRPGPDPDPICVTFLDPNPDPDPTSETEPDPDPVGSGSGQCRVRVRVRPDGLYMGGSKTGFKQCNKFFIVQSLCFVIVVEFIVYVAGIFLHFKAMSVQIETILLVV